MRASWMLRMAGALVLVMLLGFAASADVVVKQKTTSTMMGGMMNMIGHSTMCISGDKQRIDTRMETKMPMFSTPAVKTTSITRLDKELTWNIDHEQKTYLEHSFSQTRAMMDSMSMQWQSIGGQSDAPDTENMEFQKPEFKIERTGQKKKISGYKCEEVILQMIIRARDKKTGDTGSFVVHDRLWVTKDWPGQKEHEAFSKKAAEKMGCGPGMEAVGSSFAMMGLDPETLTEKLSEIGGFPMRQEMTMTISGQISVQDEEETAEQLEAMKDAAEMLKGLGGLFGKKAEAEKEPGAGPAAMFEVTIEIESVSTGNVDSSEFEVPAGYKKIGEGK